MARNESRGGTSARTTQTVTTSTSCGTPWRTGEADDGQAAIRLDYKPVTVTRYQPMERKYSMPETMDADFTDSRCCLRR